MVSDIIQIQYIARNLNIVNFKENCGLEI